MFILDGFDITDRPQQQKNGGGGRRGPPRELDYGDNNYQQQSYGGNSHQSVPSQAQAPAATGAEDPYAACK